eukprot:6856460-Prymnesium_polylepis.1
MAARGGHDPGHPAGSGSACVAEEVPRRGISAHHAVPSTWRFRTRVELPKAMLAAGDASAAGRCVT